MTQTIEYDQPILTPIQDFTGAQVILYRDDYTKQIRTINLNEKFGRVIGPNKKVFLKFPKDRTYLGLYYPGFGPEVIIK